MGLRFTYTPPARNALPIVAAAAEIAAGAAAEHILEASQRLVPVDTGALKASGHVSHDGHEAAISYGNADDATGVYGPIQHERLEFHHPNGGQAKFLEIPLHTEAGAVAEIIAAEVRKAVG